MKSALIDPINWGGTWKLLIFERQGKEECYWRYWEETFIRVQELERRVEGRFGESRKGNVRIN